MWISFLNGDAGYSSASTTYEITSFVLELSLDKSTSLKFGTIAPNSTAILEIALLSAKKIRRQIAH